MMIRAWLAHPLTVGLDIDDPRTTQLRRRILEDKHFLRQVYREWYLAIADALPQRKGPVLELGSGAGFLCEYVPGLITSEVFACPGVSIVLRGSQLPFAQGALNGIVMINVLHHLPEPRCFFSEATRCVKAGGRIVMIEPWVTRWSRIIYGKLHHEPFRPEAEKWDFPSGGPLSSANSALAWIMFQRDRNEFEQDFPKLQIQAIRPCMPFRYLLSGGISFRSLMPGWSYSLWRALESTFQPRMSNWAMFAQIVLGRVDA